MLAAEGGDRTNEERKVCIERAVLIDSCADYAAHIVVLWKVQVDGRAACGDAGTFAVIAGATMAATVLAIVAAHQNRTQRAFPLPAERQ